MDESFYKKHTYRFFDGKKGIMLKAIKNAGGDTIAKGEEVELHKRKRGLEVTSKRRRKKDGCVITITRVSPFDVGLIDKP